MNLRSIVEAWVVFPLAIVVVVVCCFVVSYLVVDHALPAEKMAEMARNREASK